MKAYAMFDPDFQDLIHITSDKKGSKFNMFSNALAATSSYIVKAEFSNESSSSSHHLEHFQQFADWQCKRKIIWSH